MSFIYAHKIDNKIRILSDTKITISPDKISWFSKDEYERIYNYGMIKTVIYKSDITISSAGNIEDFNELLEILNEKKSDELEKIICEAISIHNKYRRATDFIITDKNTIYIVKNGKCESALTAWIGDSDAFKKFQELKLTYPPSTITCISEEGIYEVEDLISSIDHSFQTIIDDKTFDTVGGAVVRCIYNQGKYEFLGSYATYSGFNFRQKLLPGESLVFEHNVEDGGFSYYAFNYNKYYTVYIEQSGKYLMYMPGYSNKYFKNLSLPQFLNEATIKMIEES